MATSTERDRLEQLLRGQHALVDQVHQWLEEDAKQDDILRAVVLSSRNPRPVHLHWPDPDRVFSLHDIRALCIKYRLRFLDAGLFKGHLPAAALQAIRQLECQGTGPITGFKFMAPAERFKLCDSEADPLLFVPLGDDRFYLVHKWGNEVSLSRAVFGLPFRSPAHLVGAVLLAAVVLTLLVPTGVLTSEPGVPYWNGVRSLFLFWSVMTLSAFTAFAWMAFFGQFSDRAWDSRYFNA